MKQGSVRLLASVVLVVFGLTACSTGAPDPNAPHIVTTKQSELLAVSRFKNFDAGSRPIETTFNQSGAKLKIKGWVDYGSGLGYVEVTGNFTSQAMLWTSSTVGIIEQEADSEGNPKLPITSLSDPGWQSRPLDSSASNLDMLLAVIGNLGLDRPDNPLLLQQSGALWLREDEVGSTPVTVFAAPPSDEPLKAGQTPSPASAILKLWVDGQGLILRAEAKIANQWTTIDFPDSSAPRLRLPEDSDG